MPRKAAPTGGGGGGGGGDARSDSDRSLAARNFAAAEQALRGHPLFAPLLARATVVRQPGNLCPGDGWAVVTSAGQIHPHPKRLAEPAEWEYVLAHCLLHLAFGHFGPQDFEHAHGPEWNAACDCMVARFLSGLQLGRAPAGGGGGDDVQAKLPASSEATLYRHFLQNGVPPALSQYGTGGRSGRDMLVRPEQLVGRWRGEPVDWQKCFGLGLEQAVTRAVDVAGGRAAATPDGRPRSPAQLARAWFMNSYPLLGALAAGFNVIEDQLLCGRMRISVAAVSAEAREVYVNPGVGMDEQECRFVMAHELLHVGLRHHARRQGRDPYLWNVACDFVINGWLIEMEVGHPPQFGLLHDPLLKGLSAETVYDRIVTDARRFRKLATLRGVGVGDILPDASPDWWTTGAGLTLDEFYRRCLGQGLAYHDEQGRGLLPAGLVEEVRALAQPPVPWDVELARWFDDHFAPVETVRSYARLSRRQSSTPDIPRPRWVPKPGAQDGRTFGVLLDTSGSMDRGLLAKALGAIASYSASRDVPAARVVFCDAAVYDQGYMPPDAIAGRVRVRGRGGTVLQPGVELLERAEDFPKDGPILVITDGACDRLRVAREHAFLLPEGRHLPFPPRGAVFRIR
jgi:predicted metal-dependent peptidase